MTPQTKLALRRFALRWLRKLVDLIDEELYIAEVNLRQEIENQAVAPLRAQLVADGRNGTSDALVRRAIADQEATTQEPMVDQTKRRSQPESFLEWEARRSGFTLKVKRHHRRRRTRSSAADFDFQIIRKREEFLQ
jgi:hypothetical protein